MKCTCGQEFEDKFCPNCGRKAENNASLNDADPQFESDNNETQVDSKEETEQSGFVNGWNKLMDYRLTIGSFVSALFVFMVGSPVSAIFLVLCGIVISPQIKARFSQYKILLYVVFFICLVIAILSFNQSGSANSEYNDLTGAIIRNTL